MIMDIHDLSSDARLDYTRLLRALWRRGDASNVPFLELSADREVIAAVLDEPVIPREAEKSDREALERGLDQKIRFWHRLQIWPKRWHVDAVCAELLRSEQED
jgi:hypothetical protein